jgi:hypothetical protein
MALSSVTIVIAEKPPETYVKNMQDMNKAVMGLRGNVEAKEWAAVAKDAAALQALLKTTEAFWRDRKTADAVVLSQNALKAAGDIAASAKAKNEEGVIAGQRALMGLCNSCHTAHRIRTPEGKYEIREKDDRDKS